MVVHCDTHWYHWKSGHVYIHYQITITIYFSQLEAAVKMIRNDWFGRKHEVVSSRTVVWARFTSGLSTTESTKKTKIGPKY